MKKMKTFGLKKLGLFNPKEVYRNLTPTKLIEMAIQRGEGVLSSTGALSVTTGKYTGRSPEDKFVVDTPDIHNKIAWGSVNKPNEKENLFPTCKIGKYLFLMDLQEPILHAEKNSG